MKLKKIKQLKSQFNEKIAKKNWEEALSILDKMIATTSSFHYKRGVLLFKLKNYQDARQCAEKALATNPQNQDALRLVEKCQQKLQVNIDKIDEQQFFASNDADVFMTNETFILDGGEQDSDDKEEFASNVTMQMPPASENQKKIHKEKTQVIQQMKREKSFDRYRIIEELGRGGMGLVYKVYDPQTDRIVALKVLLSGSFSHEKHVQRFIREIKTTANLRHPNIVTLYETGFFDNHHYFTMEYIEGVSLRSFLKNEDFPQSSILKIIIKVARAIDFAHSQGVIHRDLKPENIMLCPNNEPKVMDFGLAKSLESQDNLSMTNEILGTPAYMSPEQSESSHVTAATDVYSLGIILYEALCGRVPFRGKTLASILQQIFNDDPIAPRALNAEISKELEAICFKAIDKKVPRRYHCAQLLATDLENYLAHRPIIARPPGHITLVRKFCRRHPLLVTSLLSTIFVLSFWGYYALMQWQQSEMERQEAILQNANILMSKAREASISESWRRCGVLAGKALSIVQNLDSDKATRIQEQAYSHIRTALFRYGLLWESRDFAIAANKLAFNGDETILATALESGDIDLWGTNGHKLLSISGHFGGVTSIVFAKDILISAAHDNTIRLWNSRSGELIRVLRGHEHSIRDIELSPNNKWLVSCSQDGSICFWEMSTGKLLKKIKAHKSAVTDIDFFGDKTLASCGEDHCIYFWDVNTFRRQEQFLHHKDTVIDIAFFGHTLISTSRDKKIKFYDVKNHKHLKTISNSYIVNDMSVSEDNKIVALGGSDGNVYILDLISYNVRQTFSHHLDEVSDVHFNRNGKTLVSASTDKTVRLWDLEKQQQISEVKGHVHYVYSVAFHPQQKLIASASHDKTIRLWNTATGEHQNVFIGHSAEVNSVVFSPNGQTLASASFDKTIKLWDVEQRNVLHTFLGHKQAVLSVQFSKSGRYLLSASEDMTIKLWDVKTRKLLRTFTGHEHIVTKAIFSNDERFIVSSSYDKTVKLWNVNTGKTLKTFRGHSNIVFGIALSPDNKWIASSSEDTVIKIWNIATGKQIEELKGHEDIVYDVCFHPQKNVLISASEDKTIRIWDLDAFREMKELRGHRDIVVDIEVSNDGQLLVSSSEDHTLRLWSMDLPQLHRKLRLHKEEVYSAIFSKDGKTLISAGGDNRVCIYDIEKNTRRYLSGHSDRVKVAIFNNKNDKIISCSSDETIRVWDIATQKTQFVMQGHQDEVYCIAISHDDRTLASVSADHTLRLWDITTGKCLKTLYGHTDFVYAVAIAADGKTVATFAHDKVIGIWDAQRQTPVKKLRGHLAPGYWLEFNPSGTLLASASIDQTIRLWDVKNGKQVNQFNTNSSAGSATFSPDEQFLVTSSYSGHIFLWEIKTSTLKRKIKAHSGPIYWLDFSPDGQTLASASEDGFIRMWPINFSSHHNLQKLQLPIWVKTNMQNIPLKSQSPFNFRLDVAGSLIEYFLREDPQKITEILFGLYITKDSTITEVQATRYMFR